MVLFKPSHAVAVVSAIGSAAIRATAPEYLDATDNDSIKSVAKTLAQGAMSYYSGTAAAFADLPKPYYWWEAGALMGAMLDYSHYTGDVSYDETISTALLAQTGPGFNYMNPAHYGDEGNDDLAFWGFAVMAAAERNFAQPDEKVPAWLRMSENVWNSLRSRWDVSACGGGLPWQIFASNPNGIDYRNSVSNGGLLQLSARLARATGNDTYRDWAEKVWDWSEAVGFIGEDYLILDGASSAENCSRVNPVSFSYTQGIYMYGAAVMADVTNDTKWVNRTVKLLSGALSYFSPFENATDIMWEHACEHVNTCSVDMLSFKAYLSRFMWASTQYVPSVLPVVRHLLGTSSSAAAKACTGGKDGTTCGTKWYVGGYDGQTGLGQEMSALEIIQGLLIQDVPKPLKGDEIQVVRSFAGTRTVATPAARTSDTLAPAMSARETRPPTTMSRGTPTPESSTTDAGGTAAPTRDGQHVPASTNVQTKRDESTASCARVHLHVIMFSGVVGLVASALF